MRTLAVYTTIFVVLILNEVNSHRAELHEICEGDTVCIEKGRNCYSSFRGLHLYDDQEGTSKREAAKQRTYDCMTKSNVVRQYDEFKQNYDVEDDLNANRNPKHRGRKNAARRVVHFVLSLEKTAPDTALELRCCLMNQFSFISSNVVDKNILKSKIRDGLIDPEKIRIRDAFLGAVDTCAEPDSCRINAYTDCLVRSCITK